MTNRPFASTAAILALILMTGAATAQNSNNPIPGIDVVVKKQPQGTAIRVPPTDARGQIDFQAEATGIALLLPAIQAARETARRSAGDSPPPGGVMVRVEVGRTVLTSAPLMLTGEGRAEFRGSDGRQMVIPIPRGGGRVRITLLPCCWASDRRRSADASPAGPETPRQ